MAGGGCSGRNAAAPPSPDSSAQLLTAAREQIAASKLDSAAALLHRIVDAPARPVADRVEAWVLLGVVDLYRRGDSAAAAAFRNALALDPGLQAAGLEKLDPAAAQIFAAERAALKPVAAPVAPPGPAFVDCIPKCPAGVRPPRFAYLPHLDLENAAVFGLSGVSSFIMVHAVVSELGRIEPETIWFAGGTARDLEGLLRGVLAEARFRPGVTESGPARVRVEIRFDFEREGNTSVRYRYRVVAR